MTKEAVMIEDPTKNAGIVEEIEGEVNEAEVTEAVVSAVVVEATTSNPGPRCIKEDQAPR